ncbi:hypothetical protein SAMN04488564_10876 [Lentzea waywayandensis]|uniref:SnoaL-like domain-containing protein n=1 Tax=Lentzea waywayandensis TaxID=84724 RepID=A0A1I6F4D8_9PSEU|nr:DUF4440 domain-containing protein [Lentzea waywayandensis]SFR24798.1 hypothetical protein SAMN04488564_10876 [Lentzea waywayandensis]
MSEADRTKGIPPEHLPAAVSNYLSAHRVNDVDKAITSFTADAEVTDDGRTHNGIDEIRTWLAHAATEYTYSTELRAVTQISDLHYDVVQHLEGNFPGGVIDLHYRFVLRDASIARLAIEP